MEAPAEGRPQRPTNPQLQCPLFICIPPEIRNYIFELVLTSYDDKTRPYKKTAYYYRPSHRYARKIDTALLLTCRRVYAETEAVPAMLNEHTSWYHRAPPDVVKNGFSSEHSPAAVKRRCQLRTVHLFTQQFWLENQFVRFVPRYNHTNASRLKLTLRHTDWWYWEEDAPLALDAKCPGMPMGSPLPASEPFQHRSWGNQIRNFNNLKEFQLELETVRRKKHELDAIVARATEWELPLKGGNVLILNQAKTSRTGWVGYRLANAGSTGANEDERDFDLPSSQSANPINLPSPGVNETDANANANTIAEADDEGESETSDEDDTDSFHDALADLSNTDPEEPPDISNLESAAQPSTTNPLAKPLTAKQELVADGVKFIDEHLEPDTEDEKERMTYYIVTLTWNPRVQPA